MVFTSNNARASRKRRKKLCGRPSDVSLRHIQSESDTDRVNESDPINIQIQISDDVTNETEEESKVCEDESNIETIEKDNSTEEIHEDVTNNGEEETIDREVQNDAEKLEKETPTKDAFYMLLRSTDISDLITSNLCSKEYVSYGISTMLNDFSIIIGKQIQLAKEKLLQSNVNNRTDNNQLIVSVFENELDVNMLKRSFIRKATHQGKTKRDRNTVYKCLGDNYIDTLDVRYESYGLATSVYVDVNPNLYQQKNMKLKKKTYEAKAIQIKSPSAYKRNWSNYEINHLAVLANHCAGMGGRDFKNTLAF